MIQSASAYRNLGCYYKVALRRHPANTNGNINDSNIIMNHRNAVKSSSKKLFFSDLHYFFLKKELFMSGTCTGMPFYINLTFLLSFFSQRSILDRKDCGDVGLTSLFVLSFGRSGGSTQQWSLVP
jgi:hypothetical protein